MSEDTKKYPTTPLAIVARMQADTLREDGQDELGDAIDGYAYLMDQQSQEIGALTARVAEFETAIKRYADARDICNTIDFPAEGEPIPKDIIERNSAACQSRQAAEFGVLRMIGRDRKRA